MTARIRRPLICMLAALLVAAPTLPSAMAAPSASAPVILPLPADAVVADSDLSGLFTQMLGLSCPDDSSCTGVGQYAATGDHRRPAVWTMKSGMWKASALPLAGANPSASAEAVACTSADACVAVGEYAFEDLADGALAWTLSGGTWKMTALPLPANAAVQNAATASGVGCTAAGSCLAVGSYADADGRRVGVAWTLASGSWTVSALPIPDGEPANSSLEPQAVSCYAGATCRVIGNAGYGTHIWLWTRSAGAWTVAEQPVPTKVLSSAQGLSIACTASEMCVDVVDVGFAQRYVSTVSAGTWTHVDVDDPAPSVTAVAPWHVACGAPDACVVLGSFADVDLAQRAAAWTLTSGAWIPMPLANPSDYLDMDVSRGAVACPPRAACIAAVGYRDSKWGWHVMVWSVPRTTPPPATTKPTVRRITITCVKGKQVKRITAVAPKCPAGWKRK